LLVRITLSQHQTVTDIAFCLSIAVLVRLFYEQHPRNHFNGQGIPASFQRLGAAFG
jgi:hypothetical protein